MSEGRSLDTFLRRNATVDAEDLMSEYSGYGSSFRGGGHRSTTSKWSSNSWKSEKRQGRYPTWSSSGKSHKTHNTGFSEGTAGWAHPNYSKHAKDRRLERNIDEYVIRHVVVRGSRTEVRAEDGSLRWKFEKDGIVVISSSPDPDQVIITCFVDGFISNETCMRALDNFNHLMEELEDALDEEMRISALKTHLGPDLSRIALGVDLVRVPEDCPLLQHCAKSGYAECVKALLESGNFADGVALPCKQDMNILHYIAWEGQEDIFCLLDAEVVRKIADVRNKFGELPEETAWNRYLQLKYNEHLRLRNPKSLDHFIGLALKCLRSRLNNQTIKEDWFMTKANECLDKECDPAKETAKVPGGCDAEFVMRHFQSQDRVGRRWQTRKLQISGVDLSDEVSLKGILDCHVNNSNLEVVDFDGCAIGPRGVTDISDFIREHQGHLTQLMLRNNPIGNEGLEILLGSDSLVLTTVQKLGLSNIGLTPAGLKHITVDCCLNVPTVKKLDLDANELTETTQDCPNFAAFCQSLADFEITELGLRSTRLSEVQLHLLLDAVRVHPALHRISIQNVRIPETHQQNVGPENPLIRAMSDPRCTAKYLDISHKGCELLSRKLNAAVKSREKSQVRFSTIPEETSCDTSSTVMKRGLTFQQVEVFGRPILARIRARDYRIPQHRYARMTLETEHGQIDKVECALEKAFTEEDVGRMFWVTLRFVHDRDRNGNELLACEPVANKVDAAVTFRGLVVIFYRPATAEILMLRENDISPAANAIRIRLRDGVLSDHLATEDRFTGASKKAQKERYTLQELMMDINMVDLFDEEVRLLSQLHKPEGYTAIVHGRNRPAVSEDDAGFLRSQEVDTVQALLQLFEKELESRSKSSKTKIASGYGLWERSCSGQTFMGSAEKTRYFPKDDSLFQMFMKELFSDVVKVQTSDGTDLTENQRRLAIKVVEVSEDLLKQEELPDGSTIDLPLGLRTSAFRCKWFSLHAIPQSDRMGVSKALVRSLQKLISDSCTCKLVSK